MPKLLWIGDAVIASGFARVTHAITERLVKKDWDISIIGMCYTGDPHDYSVPVYPAMPGGDNMGLGRLKGLLAKFNPDVVLLLHDSWVQERFVPFVDRPFVTYTPVDAPNFRKQSAVAMTKFSHVIFYTQFGLAEAKKAGFSGRSSIIGHGVDTSIYHPVPRAEALQRLGLAGRLPDDVYIVGNVNRNQPRKRMDLTIQYFADWVHAYSLPSNVRLYLHCATQDIGYDLKGLAEHYGVRERMIFTEGLTPMAGIEEKDMKYIYSIFDVQMSTTLGEGWGLGASESMACAVPNIVPRWSALAEWPNHSVRYVPVTAYSVTPECVNTIGGVADRDEFIKALHEFYHGPHTRQKYGKAGFDRVHEPQFSWDWVADRFDEVLREAIDD